MKRLVAYVRESQAQFVTTWSFVVELNEGGSSATRSFVGLFPFKTFIDAEIAAETEARKHGFGLTWHGFVAHGFEIEGEKAETQKKDGGA